MDTGSYGERLDEHWHSKTIVTALSVGGPLAPDVTIARIAAGPGYGFVAPVPAQEGYALSLELMDYDKGELWLDGPQHAADRAAAQQQRLLRPAQQCRGEAR